MKETNQQHQPENREEQSAKKQRFLSPLRWPGGKSKQVKKITQLFPKDSSLLIEPFLGGGSVSLFAINNGIFNNATVNDHNEDLINFWSCLKENPKYFLEELDILLTHKNVFGFEVFAETLWPIILKNKENSDRQKKAFSFLIVNKCSFNGLGTHLSRKSYEENFNANLVERIKAASAILQKGIKIECEDFETIIKNNNFKNVFLYLDPPYSSESANQSLYKTHHNGGKGAAFDHLRLFEVLKEFKGKWLLSYDDSDFIRELYSEFDFVTEEWSYTMTNNSKDKKAKKGKEIFIKNY